MQFTLFNETTGEAILFSVYDSKDVTLLKKYFTLMLSENGRWKKSDNIYCVNEIIHNANYMFINTEHDRLCYKTIILKKYGLRL
jgi:hypothetical protein